ncbi:hypothetical protein [Sorangium cellulosum]|nr:hypothetical protein [Sorangium cellulosum]
MPEAAAPGGARAAPWLPARAPAPGRCGADAAPGRGETACHAEAR